MSSPPSAGLTRETVAESPPQASCESASATDLPAAAGADSDAVEAQGLLPGSHWIGQVPEVRKPDRGATRRESRLLLLLMMMLSGGWLAGFGVHWRRFVDGNVGERR